MTEEEYTQAEGIALELVDWLFTKSNKSHMLLTVLTKSTCLMLESTRKKEVSPTAMRKAFLKAFDQEMKCASDFMSKQQPLGRQRRAGC